MGYHLTPIQISNVKLNSCCNLDLPGICSVSSQLIHGNRTMTKLHRCTDCNDELPITKVEFATVSQNHWDSDTSKPLEWVTIPLCYDCFDDLYRWDDS